MTNFEMLQIEEMAIKRLKPYVTSNGQDYYKGDFDYTSKSTLNCASYNTALRLEKEWLMKEYIK